MDSIFQSFLNRQSDEGMTLARSSDILKLVRFGPQHFIADFSCTGLVQTERGDIVEFGQFAVGIAFPDDYLRIAETGQVLSYMGPSPRPWHPNIRPPYMCLFIKPGTPLVDIIYSCYELFTWRLYNTGDEGLNHAAAQWARKQDPSRFPTDRRPLKRRTLKLDVSPPPTEVRP